MSTRSILGWVVGLTANLRPGRSATPAASVAAAIRVERPDPATVGRRLAGPTTAGSAIERARRFTDSHRVEVAEAIAGVSAHSVRGRKKRLLVSSDRTEVRDFHRLMAAACIGGRAAPSLRASYPERQPTRSRNSPGEGPLRLPRSLIPDPLKVIIPADRGFGRAGWAAVCRGLKSRYPARNKPQVTVACSRHRAC